MRTLQFVRTSAEYLEALCALNAAPQEAYLSYIKAFDFPVTLPNGSQCRDPQELIEAARHALDEYWNPDVRPILDATMEATLESCLPLPQPYFIWHVQQRAMVTLHYARARELELSAPPLTLQVPAGRAEEAREILQTAMAVDIDGVTMAPQDGY